MWHRKRFILDNAAMNAAGREREMKDPVTNKAIRSHVMSTHEGCTRVIITRAGEVHAIGNMPRGDGGRRPWRQLVGSREQVSAEVSYERFERGDDERGRSM